MASADFSLHLSVLLSGVEEQLPVWITDTFTLLCEADVCCPSYRMTAAVI